MVIPTNNNDSMVIPLLANQDMTPMLSIAECYMVERISSEIDLLHVTYPKLSLSIWQGQGSIVTQSSTQKHWALI